MRSTKQVHHGNMPGLFEGRAGRVYDLVARRLLRGVYARFAEDLADAAPHGGSVLDVGTGPGVLLAEVARRRPDLRLTGVDLSADMAALAECNLRPYGERARAGQGDVTALPFPDDAFDLVVSSFSMHHWDDVEAAVPEIARVLRPGGRLYVYDFRSAPFDTVVAAARARSLLEGAPARRLLIRTGVPLLPRYARHVMTASS
ncbi:ubiquinone/menaquinone biosynthesis C-methylase UbiE [Nocardiopsis arvandica]|uniref:Ubiquinone/menaquinone biosynthesis C-methylase UbiE n=1 Tax=Nocardiopsis sinuspersici TaxID=501010 RepID=A0A7Y9XAK6_9ACTN|nr:class I SAM-dependent methyltransferase [Nocardiopsis sinuspersici]NYH52271.1 ubiquinone/menaquinone biosynthesis C-methylase UbiE [Nocardiopsis sinuspersici]